MNGDTVLNLILQAGPVVKLVLIILLLFSIYSWQIIIFKQWFFSKVEKESVIFNRNFIQSRNWDALAQTTKNLTLSPMAILFRALLSAKESNRDDMKRILKRVEAIEASRLEKNLNFLATTGSVTPFIGLFGTVWGIMNSFRGIGKLGSASLAVVAPGIAEALIATAAGLVTAIPAVIAYNYYLSRAQRNIIMMEDFSQELIDHFSRNDGQAQTGSVRD